MWKSIVLCGSLFAVAALGLALGARFVEPAALPAAAAIGLCLIGVVLILAAPAREATRTTTAPTTTAVSEPPVEPIELPTAKIAKATPSVSNRTPTLPFRALQS